MNEYVKKIKIEVAEAQQTSEDDKKKDDKSQKGFKKLIESLSKSGQRISQNTLSSIGKGIQDGFKAGSVGQIMAKGFNSLISGQNPLKTIFDSFLEEFANIISGSIQRMNTMLSFSQMTNSEVRDLKLSYGFSSSQAYGYQTAMETMGFSSFDDLMYMDDQQSQQFRELMTEFTNQYSELYDQGYFEKMQEYQVEMKKFRLEMEHELIDFFMDNKDTIMKAMDMIMTAGRFLVKALGWLLDFFGVDRERDSAERTRETQSILNSYSNSNSTNVNISNEFNNIAKEDTSWLAHSGQMTYEQVIKALT